MEKDVWRAPCGVTFTVTRSRSTYSIAAHDRTGKRIAWSGRNWGAALTDDLMMAAHYREPLRAHGAIWFLFGRIDGYRDCPSLQDLFSAAVLDDDTREEQDARRLQRALSEVARAVRSIGGPIHIDAIRRCEKDAMAPEGAVARLIKAGAVVETLNKRGQPAINVIALQPGDR